MVYYKPGVELAYNSVKDIHFVVPAGRFTATSTGGART
jgi:hypothetical protein